MMAMPPRPPSDLNLLATAAKGDNLRAQRMRMHISAFSNFLRGNTGRTEMDSRAALNLVLASRVASKEHSVFELLTVVDEALLLRVKPNKHITRQRT